MIADNDCPSIYSTENRRWPKRLDYDGQPVQVQSDPVASIADFGALLRKKQPVPSISLRVKDLERVSLIAEWFDNFDIHFYGWQFLYDTLAWMAHFNEAEQTARAPVVEEFALLWIEANPKAFDLLGEYHQWHDLFLPPYVDEWGFPFLWDVFRKIVQIKDSPGDPLYGKTKASSASKAQPSASSANIRQASHQRRTSVPSLQPPIALQRERLVSRPDPVSPVPDFSHYHSRVNQPRQQTLQTQALQSQAPKLQSLRSQALQPDGHPTYPAFSQQQAYYATAALMQNPRPAPPMPVLRPTTVHSPIFLRKDSLALHNAGPASPRQLYDSDPHQRVPLEYRKDYRSDLPRSHRPNPPKTITDDARYAHATSRNNNNISDRSISSTAQYNVHPRRTSSRSSFGQVGQVRYISNPLTNVSQAGDDYSSFRSDSPASRPPTHHSIGYTQIRSEEVSASRIWIGNIPPHVSLQQVIDIVKDQQGYQRVKCAKLCQREASQFAIVQFASQEHAERAIHVLPSSESFQANNLVVKFADDRPPPGHAHADPAAPTHHKRLVHVNPTGADPSAPISVRKPRQAPERQAAVTEVPQKAATSSAVPTNTTTSPVIVSKADAPEEPAVPPKVESDGVNARGHGPPSVPQPLDTPSEFPSLSEKGKQQLAAAHVMALDAGREATAASFAKVATRSSNGAVEKPKAAETPAKVCSQAPGDLIASLQQREVLAKPSSQAVKEVVGGPQEPEMPPGLETSTEGGRHAELPSRAMNDADHKPLKLEMSAKVTSQGMSGAVAKSTESGLSARAPSQTVDNVTLKPKTPAMPARSPSRPSSQQPKAPRSTGSPTACPAIHPSSQLMTRDPSSAYDTTLTSPNGIETGLTSFDHASPTPNSEIIAESKKTLDPEHLSDCLRISGSRFETLQETDTGLAETTAPTSPKTPDSTRSATPSGATVKEAGAPPSRATPIPTHRKKARAKASTPTKITSEIRATKTHPDTPEGVKREYPPVTTDFVTKIEGPIKDDSDKYTRPPSSQKRSLDDAFVLRNAQQGPRHGFTCEHKESIPSYSDRPSLAERVSSTAKWRTIKLNDVKELAIHDRFHQPKVNEQALRRHDDPRARVPVHCGRVIECKLLGLTLQTEAEGSADYARKSLAESPFKDRKQPSDPYHMREIVAWNVKHHEWVNNFPGHMIFNESMQELMAGRIRAVELELKSFHELYLGAHLTQVNPKRGPPSGIIIQNVTSILVSLERLNSELEDSFEKWGRSMDWFVTANQYIEEQKAANLWLVDEGLPAELRDSPAILDVDEAGNRLRDFLDPAEVRQHLDLQSNGRGAASTLDANSTLRSCGPSPTHFYYLNGDDITSMAEEHEVSNLKRTIKLAHAQMERNAQIEQMKGRGAPSKTQPAKERAKPTPKASKTESAAKPVEEKQDENKPPSKSQKKSHKHKAKKNARATENTEASKEEEAKAASLAMAKTKAPPAIEEEGMAVQGPGPVMTAHPKPSASPATEAAPKAKAPANAVAAAPIKQVQTKAQVPNKDGAGAEPSVHSKAEESRLAIPAVTTPFVPSRQFKPSARGGGKDAWRVPSGEPVWGGGDRDGRSGSVGSTAKEKK